MSVDGPQTPNLDDEHVVGEATLERLRREESTLAIALEIREREQRVEQMREQLRISRHGIGAAGDLMHHVCLGLTY